MECTDRVRESSAGVKGRKRGARPTLIVVEEANVSGCNLLLSIARFPEGDPVIL